MGSEGAMKRGKSIWCACEVWNVYLFLVVLY